MNNSLRRCLIEMERDEIDVLVLGREANSQLVSGVARSWLAGTRDFSPACVVVRQTSSVYIINFADSELPPQNPQPHLLPLSLDPQKTVQRIAALPGIPDAARIGLDGLSPLF